MSVFGGGSVVRPLPAPGSGILVTIPIGHATRIPFLESNEFASIRTW